MTLTVVIMATSIWIVTNQQAIVDWWKLRDYQASAEIIQLVTDSGMSEEGERLFFIHAPELLDKEGFKGKCDIGEETIILGCYITHDKIYIFNVNDERLGGIEEVTAAHEMLHAVYDRLNDSVKEELEPILLSTFEDLNDDRLNNTIESYRERDPSIVVNELHSILATEVRELPTELEEHYSKYFDDRLEVVTLAEAYEAEFTNLETQIEDYDKQIDELGKDITLRQSDLEQLSSALQTEQQQLESLRSSPSQYNNAVPAYNQKVREYNTQLNQLRDLINSYNQLVEQRNAIAVEEQDLIQSIDSNYSEL